MTKYSRTELEAAFPELSIRLYDRIDSTNSEAKRLAASVFETEESGREVLTPTLFIADSQSSGRGRLGRTFYSPEHTGIYMTLLYPVDAPYDTAVRITAKTAAAAYEGLYEVTGLPLSIKWVNDIYLYDRKIAGILVESVADSGKVLALVIGIGINVTTEEWPEELENIAGALGDSSFDRTGIVIAVIRKLMKEVSNLDDLHYLEIYRQASCVLGKTVDYTRNGVTKTGTAVSIDDRGALIVETEGGREILDSGEISVRVKRS